MPPSSLPPQALQNLDQSASGSGVTWAESVLLQAAVSHGYSLPALAAGELQVATEALLRSVADERAAVVAANSHLLSSILTPVQAVRYFAVSQSFMWNALAFANAVVARGRQGGSPASPPGR